MKKYQKLWLDQINQIIEQNIQNPDFQLADITSELEISRTKLYRNVVKLTGHTPSHYIRMKRLEKAKEILDVGIYPTVKETAAEVGYRNPNYFSKLFYKEYQILPSDLLKN